MLNYYETDLELVTPDIKKEIFDFFEKDFTNNVTSDHNHLVDNTTFIFSKLPDRLNDKILELLPEKFKRPELDPFIRIQYTANGTVDPHIDRGRISGLITVLTDDLSCTSFFNWKPAASRRLRDFMVVENLQEIEPAETVIFDRDKTYLFNHAAIHSVAAIHKPRLTLNILFCSLPYNDLVKIYAD